MTTITSAPVATSAPTAPKAVATAPRANGGVQGVIGDLIRSGAAGYEQSTNMTSVQADKAAIHPFEAVETATGLLKSSTAKIKGVGKATSILHTVGGFAMLIMAANVGSSLKTPGQTGVDVGNRVADLIDGKKTANGWSLGWGIETDANGTKHVKPSTGSSALDALGVK